MEFERTYVSVDLGAVCHNVRQVRRKLPKDGKLLAVVKADAYGHGAVPVAMAIQRAGLAEYFGVATVGEGIELRRGGVSLPVLILGYCSPELTEDLLRFSLTPTLYREDVARAFSEAAVRAGQELMFHAAIDTGMSRIGFPVSDEGAEAVARICRLPGLRPDGIFSHYATADETDKTLMHEQTARFRTMLTMLSARGVAFPNTHLCNSAGILECAEFPDAMVRAGIVIYGVMPSDEVTGGEVCLRPALTWKTVVVHVKTVPAGTPVSYGATWVAPRPTTVATVPVGYADGYARSLSNSGCVLIRGKRAPIIGRVCMDQMMVDVTDIPDVAMGDEVTLLGTDGAECITLEEMEHASGRCRYELVCAISKRVPRFYTGGAGF